MKKQSIFRKYSSGFTLAELLISLAILGVIATFTIPKILSTQQANTYNSIAKEDIQAVSAAFTIAQNAGVVTGNTAPIDLTPYLNYTSIDTTSVIDHQYGWGTLNCSNVAPCYRMHNGSLLYLHDISFGGTNTTNAIYYFIDPDGQLTDNTTNGPGKSVSIFIYFNGRTTSRDTILPNTTSSNGPRGPDSNFVPPWFSW